MQTQTQREQQHARRRSYANLALAAVTVVLIVALLHHPLWLWFILLPVAVFASNAVRQDRASRRIELLKRSTLFYQRGLARLGDTWAGGGETGERFLDPLHPYARDLDIFGNGSLFELLSLARTRAGEETLAAWLLAPAVPDEARARQDAVREISTLLDLREKLSSLGESVRLGVQPQALCQWGEVNTAFASPSLRLLVSVLGALWLAGIACWIAFGWMTAALLLSLLNFGFAWLLRSRFDAATSAVEAAAPDLALLAGVLLLLEQQQFHAPRLSALQRELAVGDIPPSSAIGRLQRLAGTLESRRNPIGRFLDVLTFWSAHVLFLTERWRKRYGSHIRAWLNAVGEFEALASLSGYAYEHPNDPFPEFVENGPFFEGRQIAHPLLPESRAVRNDLTLNLDARLMILSGPNMAGKSTFIRSIGINVVLAQCGAPVRAQSLRLSPLAIGTSICILDSLQGGASRFYAEIVRVKLIFDLAARASLGTDAGAHPLPVLFLLDELLSGTNSHDRLDGTRFVVESLLERGAIGMVSTHDLALTAIPQTLGARAFNCHFEDHLENGHLVFDYKLKPGIVQTSNALELMRQIGLHVPKQTPKDTPKG